MKRVEREPPRPRRPGRVGIHRDDFEEEAVAQAQQQVVRAHARVLAAGLQLDAERVADEGGALRSVGAVTVR
jgi:hypothetical protein